MNIKRTVKRFFKQNTTVSSAEKRVDSERHLSQTDKYEHCALCGKRIDITKSTRIESREYYEIGCGQLCVECHKKLSKPIDGDHTLSEAQIEFAVSQSRIDTSR